MNINKLTALIPASFEYKYRDAEDIEQTETIHLKLKRFSFNQVTSEAFDQAIKTNDGPLMAQLLSEVVGEWDLYLDDEEIERYPITAENIGTRPFDFISAMGVCVFEKLTPNPTIAADSLNGSEPAASQSHARAMN